MNQTPPTQKFLTYLAWTVTGLMALGSFIGVLNDTWDFVTLPLSLAGTLAIIIIWFAARFYLPRYPWQTAEGRITRLGPGIALPLLGMILLLWLPHITALMPEPLEFPAEREGETLIVIATFHRTDEVMDTNIHGEIHARIEAKLVDLDVDNVRVQIEPTTITTDDRQAAEALGEQYDVSMIIWGADTGVRLQVNFLNLKEPDLAAAEVTLSETQRTQLAQPEAYSQFIVKDLPNQLSYLALFAIGQAFSIDHDFEKAIPVIQEALALLPQNENLPDEYDLDEAYYFLGWLYQQTGSDDKALPIFNRTIELNPQLQLAFNGRGATYARLGNQEQAIADFTQAIALDPESAMAFYNRGNSYALLGEYNQAIIDLSESITLHPDDPRPFINRGNVYELLNEYEQAIADYTQAINLAPEFAVPFNNRGGVYQIVGEHEQAMADLNHAIDLAPEFAAPFYNRGRTHLDRGEYERAVADYSQAIELELSYSLAYYYRAISYNELGEHEQAIADYSQAIELEPSHVSSFYNRALSYAELGEHEQAIADYSQAISLDPQNAQAFFNRANAYVMLYEYEPAIVDYTQAITLNPQDTLAIYLRGIVYEEMGQPMEAIRDYRRYLELGPRPPFDRESVKQRISELESQLENQ